VGNPKVIFNIIIHILQIIYATSEENKEQPRTATLAVYLLLFSESYYLHSHSIASGLRYRRSACIDIDMLNLAAAAAYCDMG